MTTDGDAVPEKKRRRSKPVSGEAYEARLHALAYEVAEEQLLKREASSQVITHLLKEGSVRGQLELERLRKENLLTEAKIKNLDQLDDIARLLSEARDAMVSYRTGEDPVPDA